MRTSSDIDILVHDGDFDKIAALMTDCGFELKSREKRTQPFFGTAAI